MQKTCKQCQQQFEITDDDLKFYEKVSPVFGGKKYLIPAPTLCPDCRVQRRLAVRIERSLYNRKCDLTGKQMISMFSPDKPYKVYDFKEWFGDKWNALDYGRDFDFNRPFFEQFKELNEVVPKMSLINLEGNENCDYTNLSARNKDSYLIFAANDNENCYYSLHLNRDHNVMDCLFVYDSELCYQCLDCFNCFNVQWGRICEKCSDSKYISECKNCRNCFGCVALFNKEYFILNKEYSEKDYFIEVTKISSDPKLLQEFKNKYDKLVLEMPKKYYAGISNESVSGDHILFSKNVYNSFDVTYSEDCKYCTWLHKSKNCYDVYAWGFGGELGYENHLTGLNFYNVRFCNLCWGNVAELTYCYSCTASKNLFGCVGLKRNEYCILNKQYTKEEYEKLVPKIIEHMMKERENGEASRSFSEGWGEFFPHNISMFGYNETTAQDYFPLSKEEVLKRGWIWSEQDEVAKYQGVPLQINEDINFYNDETKAKELLNSILICEVTGKPYKIIPQELAFYLKQGIPIPRRCPDQRFRDRLALRNPRKLWDRKCMKCEKEIKTTYAPERKEIVYCEECYQKEIY